MQILKMFAFFMLCFTVLLMISCQNTDVIEPDDDKNSENIDTKKDIKNTPNKVRILYTANLDGCIMPGEYKFWWEKKKIYKPGFARLATVLSNLRNEKIPTLTISGGNDYGREFYEEFNGVATAMLLDKIGYNVITPDVNEFNDEEITYDASIKDTKYDVISWFTAYETRSLKRRVKPYVIKEINGHKIGFLTPLNFHGTLSGEGLPVTQTNPDYLSSRASMLSRRIKKIRDAGAEIVVLLLDRKQFLDTTFIEKGLVEIDFAIRSISEKSYFNKNGSETQKWVTNLSKTKTPLYLYPYLSRGLIPVLQIDIEFVKGKDGKTVLKQSHEMIKITQDTPEDPKIKEMIDEFASQLP